MGGGGEGGSLFWVCFGVCVRACVCVCVRACVRVFLSSSTNTSAFFIACLNFVCTACTSIVAHVKDSMSIFRDDTMTESLNGRWHGNTQIVEEG